MSEQQPLGDRIGNPMELHDLGAPAGLNVRASYDKPGPPPDEGAADGDWITDSKGQSWVRADGAWQPAFAERMVYVVVSAPGPFEIPRAWAFDDEQAAVNFRLSKLEDGHRRPGTLSPVFAVPVNNTAHSGYEEIDWKKYPAPARPANAKKFS